MSLRSLGKKKSTFKEIRNMIKTAKVTWIDGFRVEGITDNEKTVIMDTGENAVAASHRLYFWRLADVQ